MYVQHFPWCLAGLDWKGGSIVQKHNNNYCFHQLAVDKNYRSPCPSVLYRANDDQTVRPKLHMDQVDRKHIYVPFQNQVGAPTTLANLVWGSRRHFCSKVLLFLR